MNNGKKPYPFSGLGSRIHRYSVPALVAVLALLPAWAGAGLAFASAQVTPPVPVSATSVPASSTIASSDTALPVPLAATTDSEVFPSDQKTETGDDLQNISTDEVLNMLRSGNTSEPLNVRQLAAINNLIKRMEYISQVEQKMSDMTRNLGGATPLPASPVSPPVMRSPQDFAVASNSDARTYSISRVSGASGKFTAVLTNGTSQVQVKQGDTTLLGRVTSISLDGVTIETSTGSVQLPFSSPISLGGVSATFGTR